MTDAPFFLHSSSETIALELSETLSSRFSASSSSLGQLLFLLYFNALEGSLRLSLDNFTEDNLVPLSWTKENMPALCPQIPDILSSFPRLFGSPLEYKPVILFQGFLYLQKYFSLEQNLARLIHLKLQPDHEAFDELKVKKAITEAEVHLKQERSFSFDEQQIASLSQIFHSRFVILSGGPGTGKTSLIVNMLRAFLYFHIQNSLPIPRIQLAAPTGRASARITDALNAAQNASSPKTELQKLCDSHLPQKAYTLHRLLGQTPSFTREKKTKTLSCDMIIIDEASMIDLCLMENLLSALPQSCRLVLVGDKDQLPPVEQGPVFHDLCPEIQDTLHPLSRHTVHLQKSYRFKGELSQLASLLRQNNYQEFIRLLEACTFASFEDIPQDQVLSFIPLPEEPSLIKKSLFKAIPCFFEPFLKTVREKDSSPEQILNSIFACKILCPTHEGLLGIKQINPMCQSLFSPEGNPFYHGLPIMMESNHPSLGLSNGDQGILFFEGSAPGVFFPSAKGPSRFTLSELPSFVIAYASTIHKSQGSEYENVMVLLPTRNNALFSKELLYTAITRSKKRLILAGSLELFKNLGQNSIKRKNGLIDRLVAFQKDSSDKKDNTD